MSCGRKNGKIFWQYISISNNSIIEFLAGNELWNNYEWMFSTAFISPNSMDANDATAVLDYFRQLAGSPDRFSLDGVMLGLAPIFGADGIGLSRMEASSPHVVVTPTRALPEKYPWQTDDSLLNRLHSSLCAE